MFCDQPIASKKRLFCEFCTLFFNKLGGQTFSAYEFCNEFCTQRKHAADSSAQSNSYSPRSRESNFVHAKINCMLKMKVHAKSHFSHKQQKMMLTHWEIAVIMTTGAVAAATADTATAADSYTNATALKKRGFFDFFKKMNTVHKVPDHKPVVESSEPATTSLHETEDEEVIIGSETTFDSDSDTDTETETVTSNPVDVNTSTQSPETGSTLTGIPKGDLKGDTGSVSDANRPENDQIQEPQVEAKDYVGESEYEISYERGYYDASRDFGIDEYADVVGDTEGALSSAEDEEDLEYDDDETDEFDKTDFEDVAYSDENDDVYVYEPKHTSTGNISASFTQAPESTTLRAPQNVSRTTVTGASTTISSASASASASASTIFSITKVIPPRNTSVLNDVGSNKTNSSAERVFDPFPGLIDPVSLEEYETSNNFVHSLPASNGLPAKKRFWVSLVMSSVPVLILILV